MARTLRRVVIRLVVTVMSAAPVSAQNHSHSAASAFGQAPIQTTSSPAAPGSDTSQISSDALGWLQSLIRINTTNPPGNELVAAKYIAGLLDKEGIHSEIFESTFRPRFPRGAAFGRRHARSIQGACC